jgi:hypothetical protein
VPHDLNISRDMARCWTCLNQGLGVRSLLLWTSVSLFGTYCTMWPTAHGNAPKCHCGMKSDSGISDAVGLLAGVRSRAILLLTRPGLKGRRILDSLTGRPRQPWSVGLYLRKCATCISRFSKGHAEIRTCAPSTGAKKGDKSIHIQTILFPRHCHANQSAKHRMHVR